MSLAVFVLVGAGFGLGLTLLVAGSVSNVPDLRSALASANAEIRPSPPATAAPVGRWQRLLADALTRLSDTSLVRVPTQSLELISLGRAQFVGQKLAAAGLAAASPLVLALVSALLGAPLPYAVPAGLSLVLAAIGYMLPDVSVRRRAEEARAQFQQGMIAYLTLVALERRAGAGPHQALVQAADVADSWVWRRIRAALDHAMLGRRPTWEGLRDLSRDLDISELADCADIIATGSEGTAVADNLLARARSLRVETLNAQRRAANEASERLVVPVAVLGLCFVALLLYPVVVRLTTT